MSSRVHRVRLVAIAAAAFVLLAGCATDSSESRSEPSTSPTTSPPEPTKTPGPVDKPGSLVAVGDIACDPTSPYFQGMPGFCEHEQVAKRVGALVRQGADWFVPLGDIQYETGGYDAFTQVYDRSFGRFLSITTPVAGNHEWYTDGASGYFKYFGEQAGTPNKPWRSFQPSPGWQVLLLDSNCEFVGGCGPDSPQGRWISRTLAKSPADCVVAAWHHPLRTSGEYAGVVDSSERARQLWDQVDEGGGDIVLNGHDHIYERFKKFGGIQQFTAGTGGKNPNEITTEAPGSLKAIGNEYGVLLLTMNADATYRFEFVASDGRVLDRGNESCTNEPVS